MAAFYGQFAANFRFSGALALMLTNGLEINFYPNLTPKKAL